MRKTSTIVCIIVVLILGIAVNEISAQTAYGVSIVRADESTRIVDGYSGTWLDYYAGLYYDPEVYGEIYRTDNPETSLSSGGHIGYADIVPAEVYLRTTNYVEGKTYCTYSTHWVWGVFYYPANNWWFDPFQYSLNSTGVPPWSGYPFSYYYVIPRRYRLGVTQACITIPYPPTPTPEPTPTPTPVPTPTPTPLPSPSPTPCAGVAAGSCTEYIVRVSTSHSQLRPAGTTGGNNTARVSVCIEPAAANHEATLRVLRRPQHVNTGGHVESLHTGTRPLGKLASVRGTTGANGCFSTTYSPSHIGGIVGIDGTISGTSEGIDIYVRVDGLFDLGPGDDYTLIGSKPWHPKNHFGTGPANLGLKQIASAYRTEFYGAGPISDSEKVAFNDISLEFGGKFDLKLRWENLSKQHGEHRMGINCDHRSNNIPPTRHNRLMAIFFENGSTRTLDERNTSQPHWHLRFEFGTSQAAAERTPHTFIEDVFNAALDRESTQSEYEGWLAQVTAAKANGPEYLLEEAQHLEQSLFVSAEYVGRNRTNPEFVDDVFMAHMLREPTAEEHDYWLNVLYSIRINDSGSYSTYAGGGGPGQQERNFFVRIMGEKQEFQDNVNSIVDPISPDERTNFALASNGGVATASSQFSAAYPVASTNNGDRKGLNWGAGGGWNDATSNVYPDSPQIDFNGTKTIDEIDVFTVQNTFNTPAEPTEAMTFSLYGITAFDVQYWNGSAWVTVPNGAITGNNKVWRKVTFSPIQTTKIRVQVNAALANYSRIVEVEAWGGSSTLTP